MLGHEEKVLKAANPTRIDSSHTWRGRPGLKTWRSIRVQHSLLLFALAALVTVTGCHSMPKLPAKDSQAYAEVVSAFYVGLAALQVGDDVHAESKLSEVTQLVPGEPAGWANWGILALRQRNYDTAEQRLDRARDLAPKNDRIYDLLGILESQRGHSAEAIAGLRKAVELNPQNLRALYRLAASAKDSDRPTGQSGCVARTEPRRGQARRRCYFEIGSGADQRTFVGLAARGATSAGSRAVSRSRRGPASRRDADYLSA